MGVQQGDSGAVSVPAGVLRQELPERESVALNLQTEEYYGLDRVGTRMWQVLEEVGSVEEAYRLLLDEFAVEPEVLRRDLRAFVDQLATRGLLTRSDG
jgi:hypothetical protein